MHLNMIKRQKYNGFTVIELLIVIVVIGLLVALVVGAYSGVMARADKTRIATDLKAAAKQLEADKATSSDGSYPATEQEANGGKGLPRSNGTTYTYTVSGTGPDRKYYLTASSDKSPDLKAHLTSEDRTVKDGPYQDHVAVDPSLGWNATRTIWILPDSGVSEYTPYNGKQRFRMPGNGPYLADGYTTTTTWRNTSPGDCEADGGYWSGSSYIGASYVFSFPTDELAANCPGGGQMNIALSYNTSPYDTILTVRYYTQPQP